MAALYLLLNSMHAAMSSLVLGVDDMSSEDELWNLVNAEAWAREHNQGSTDAHTHTHTHSLSTHCTCEGTA